MAAGWPEMGMDFAMAMGLQFDSSASAANVPYTYGLPATNTTTNEPALRIDDILDFSDHNNSSTNNNAEPAHIVAPPPENTPSSIAADMTRSFADDLYNIPCEEAAELEWLSQFVEDSFSNIPYPLSTASQPPTTAVTAGSGHREAGTAAPPRGARSKRSRVSPAHHNQNQLLNAWSAAAAAAAHSTSSSTTTSSSSSSDFSSSKPRGGGHRRRGGDGGGEDGCVRRCTHCASEKTPQWRTGPLGPKTLCNACGVRFKSGRLVPEYRPAASPTFVLAHHSNSHRKVMELRRQKELVLLRPDGGGHHHHHPSAAEEMLYHDYDVC